MIKQFPRRNPGTKEGVLTVTDKEFKRLGRAQLLDIIYQLQLQVDDLTEKNKALENALRDKHLRINSAGNLAQAALEINNCFRNAQKAADQYLNEIKEMCEKSEIECERLVAEARAEAESIIAGAKRMREDYNCDGDELLKEYRLLHSDNG